MDDSLLSSTKSNKNSSGTRSSDFVYNVGSDNEEYDENEEYNMLLRDIDIDFTSPLPQKRQKKKSCAKKEKGRSQGRKSLFLH